MMLINSAFSVKSWPLTTQVYLLKLLDAKTFAQCKALKKVREMPQIRIKLTTFLLWDTRTSQFFADLSFLVGTKLANHIQHNCSKKAVRCWYG